MKILARWSAMLALAFTIGLSAVETKVNATPISANDSQKNTTTQSNNNFQDKKLVKKTALVSRSGARSFRATAYCLKGRTANGGGVRRGIVAADRRVLPLGTKILVESAGYTGVYTVTDTGGAVKGNIIDVWVPSCAEAIRFGRRAINVTVLGN